MPVPRIAHAHFGVDASGVSLEDTTLLPMLTRVTIETRLSLLIGTHSGGISTIMELVPAAAERKDDLIINIIKIRCAPAEYLAENISGIAYLDTAKKFLVEAGED